VKAEKQAVLVDSDRVSFQQVLQQVQEELDDHRQAINENTDEVQANHSYLMALEEKLDKLHARVEELILLVAGKREEQKLEVKPLTPREKEVFQALYIVGETQPWVSYAQLARKLCITENLVSGFITNLVEKGVPVLKKYDAGKAFVQLEPKFRQKQAKEVVIGLNSLLSNWIRPSES
jgi:biotin operon repressor